MTKKVKRQFYFEGTDELVAFLESLPRVAVSYEGAYTYKDRAHDFLSVFGGNSTREQGMRVLAQISQICDPVPRFDDADKPGTLAMKAGMRRVMHEIMLCMVNKEQVKVEPASNPKER